MLAKALRGPRKRTFTSSITSKQGDRVHTSQDIAKEFSEFYHDLYTFNPTQATGTSGDSITEALEYIRASGMPSLPSDASETLESLITEEEVGSAIAQTKPH